MKALKALVIGMGVLIVLAIFLLGYGLYKRTAEPDWRLFEPSHSEDASNAPANIGTISLGLPPGCQISDVVFHGATALVTIGPDKSCNQVIVIDLRSGNVTGRLQP